MAIKTIGKAAIKAKRQAAKDAIKRSNKVINIKEGTKLGESKFVKSSKEIKDKFTNKLEEIKDLKKNKKVAIKNYKGFNPKQIKLSNANQNIDALFKELNGLVKGFGKGSKIGKSIPKAEKMLTKLEKQALGQQKQIDKTIDKKLKESGGKRKITKSKTFIKKKPKKGERSPTITEVKEKVKIDKLRPKSSKIGANAKIQARLIENQLKVGTKKDKFKNLRTDSSFDMKPLMGKARENKIKELKEVQSQFDRKKGGPIIKRKRGGLIKPRGYGAARYKGRK